MEKPLSTLQPLRDLGFVGGKSRGGATGGLSCLYSKLESEEMEDDKSLLQERWGAC